MEGCRASWSVATSPDGCILIPLRDPSDPRFPRISVYDTMGNLLQIIGVGGDSDVEYVDHLCALTVDVKGIVWFSAPGAICSLRTHGRSDMF